jgi:hypothetical protein
MGQSQLLIIAVSVLIIGIAILAAVGYFRTGDADANKKAMINDINQIAHLSVLYYSRPFALQGGNHSFVGFVIPDKFQSNLNGSYDATPISASLLSITGKSKRDSSNTVTAQIGTDGKAFNWTFTGDF